MKLGRNHPLGEEKNHNIKPERRALLHVKGFEHIQLRGGQCRHTHPPGNRLTGRYPEIDVAHEIARGQRLDSVGRQAWSRPARTWKQHHDAGEFAVNLFVRSEIVVEFEERLPVDKPTRCAFPST